LSELEFHKKIRFSAQLIGDFFEKFHFSLVDARLAGKYWIKFDNFRKGITWSMKNKKFQKAAADPLPRDSIAWQLRELAPNPSINSIEFHLIFSQFILCVGKDNLNFPKKKET
jgi:hypothetical protein